MAGYFFNTNNPLVVKAYNELENFLIDYSITESDYCAIYFTSNGIYYPDDESAVLNNIYKKNRYEFFKNRIEFCKKHIFLRDVHKQWYVCGINKELNSVDKLADFLKKETSGYKIITVGSSAGGYASALFGELLHAKYSICIDAQFNLCHPLIKKDWSTTYPLLEKIYSMSPRYFDLSDVIQQTPIFYINSFYSKIDAVQRECISSKDCVHIIPFKSKIHGKPCNNVLYSYLLNLDFDSLLNLSNKLHDPNWFLLVNIYKKNVFKNLIKKIMKKIKYRNFL